MSRFTLRIFYRRQWHWTGGYTKAQFDRAVQPLIDQFEHNIINQCQFTGAAARDYEIFFPNESSALEFRKVLQHAMKVLHPKASFGWNII